MHILWIVEDTRGSHTVLQKRPGAQDTVGNHTTVGGGWWRRMVWLVICLAYVRIQRTAADVWTEQWGLRLPSLYKHATILCRPTYWRSCVCRPTEGRWWKHTTSAMGL